MDEILGNTIPERRIRWKYGFAAASFDQSVIRKWFYGKITTEMAIKLLEKSVEHEITEEMFIQNMEWLGWSKTRKVWDY